MIDSKKITNLALAVLETEAQAILNLKSSINKYFIKACTVLLLCKGRIIVTGIGKSGHIANKIAATLASTGSPAFFMHPSEASHGDIGVITKKDVVIALSNSGNTTEVLEILPTIKILGIPLISITGNPNSTLAKNSTISINVSVDKEACPLGIVPTSSTTATLAMGDALAISLLESRGFTTKDFARSHPGGTLGKRLLLKVSDLMRVDKEIPITNQDTLLSEALIEITNKRLGMTTIVNHDGILIGIFTDGDLRRIIDKNVDVRTTKMSEVMTTSCKIIPADTLAIEAIQIMEQHQITSLIITDDINKPIGVVHMHDLLTSGLL